MPDSPASVVRVRRAVAGDLAALVALEEASFVGDRLSRAQYRRHLDSDSALVLAASVSGQLLGSAVLFFRKGSQVARLYSLATQREARGRGVGGALLDAAARQARQRGCHALRLEVRADNAAAIRLYEKHGYQRSGQLTAYYEDGGDGWRYEKALTE